MINDKRYEIYKSLIGKHRTDKGFLDEHGVQVELQEGMSVSAPGRSSIDSSQERNDAVPATPQTEPTLVRTVSAPANVAPSRSQLTAAAPAGSNTVGGTSRQKNSGTPSGLQHKLTVSKSSSPVVLSQEQQFSGPVEEAFNIPPRDRRRKSPKEPQPSQPVNRLS